MIDREKEREERAQRVNLLKSLSVPLPPLVVHGTTAASCSSTHHREAVRWQDMLYTPCETAASSGLVPQV